MPATLGHSLSPRPLVPLKPMASAPVHILRLSTRAHRAGAPNFGPRQGKLTSTGSSRELRYEVFGSHRLVGLSSQYLATRCCAVLDV
jgi:hypothetical protein